MGKVKPTLIESPTKLSNDGINTQEYIMHEHNQVVEECQRVKTDNSNLAYRCNDLKQENDILKHELTRISNTKNQNEQLLSLYIDGQRNSQVDQNRQSFNMFHPVMEHGNSVNSIEILEQPTNKQLMVQSQPNIHSPYTTPYAHLAYPQPLPQDKVLENDKRVLLQDVIELTKQNELRSQVNEKLAAELAKKGVNVDSVIGGDLRNSIRTTSGDLKFENESFRNTAQSHSVYGKIGAKNATGNLKETIELREIPYQSGHSNNDPVVLKSQMVNSDLGKTGQTIYPQLENVNSGLGPSMIMSKWPQLENVNSALGPSMLMSKDPVVLSQ